MAGKTRSDRIRELLRSEPYPMDGDWSATPVAGAQGKPMRSRGSLTQAQLKAAERYAIKYGIALPSPTNPSAREMALTTLHFNMRSATVAQPSVAGDALRDTKKARG
jgi:hypothetical protein